MKTHRSALKLGILALLSFSLVLISKPAYSQTGTTAYGKIVGKVVDAETGETVIGANVAITGTTKGAATDLDGNYAIRNLKPGIYSLTVSYISYTEQTITGIEVKAGETVTYNISLRPETVGLDEVVVTASADLSGEAGLLAVQRKSISVQDGISSEQISKLGDGDVGQAIKRVTGVTVQNGKDVFVRGLGNRYSNVQLNGSQLPSTNPNRKEAPVDLFGSGLISNIVVQKTYTADQLAEFSGGSVKITTREFPEERNLTLSYSTKYRSNSTFENTLTSAGSSTDFLGFDDGKRSLPSVLDNQRITSQIAADVARGLHNDWNIRNTKSAIPSQSVSVNYANQFNEDKMPIGVVGNFSYKYSLELEANKTQRSILNFTDTGVNYYSDYMQDEGVQSADLSGMLNLFVKPNPLTKIGLKTLYSNSTSNSKSVLQGPYQNGVNRITVLDYDRRTILSTTLEAQTYFEGFMSSTLSGNISYNLALRDRPDRRSTRYNLAGDEYRFAPFGDNNGHFFSEQEDNNYTAEIKYEFKPAEFLNVSAGGNGILKDRTFTSRRIAYRDQVAPFVGDMATESPDVVLSDEMIANGTIEMIEGTQFGLNQSDWYDGYQTIMGGFISTKWNLVPDLSFELGARVERSLQTIDVPTFPEAGEEGLTGEYVEASKVDNTDLLPAANATFEISERTNLRAAYSRTLARPEFREISNFNFRDFFGGRRIYGNPELKRTRITNYDLRFETYPNAGELFAISAFYKRFEDPIELFYRFTDNNEVFYNNAEEANLYGVEIEGRKNISPRFQIVANASFIYSETTMYEEDANRVANVDRPMMGQSPYSLNLSSFYAIPEWNMDLSVSYNTFGERIVTVGKNAQQDDEYEQPFHDVGAKIDFRGVNNIGLSLEVSNLLNDERVYKQNSVTTFKYSPGVTYSLGITLSL